MCTFEILTLVLLLLPSVFLLWLKPPVHWFLRAFSAAALLGLTIHAVIEGIHWQLLPLYLSGLLLFVVLFTKLRSRVLFVRVCGCASVLLILCADAFSYILPMFRLPAPGWLLSGGNNNSLLGGYVAPRGPHKSPG
jgi:hypothetical protein